MKKVQVVNVDEKKNNFDEVEYSLASYYGRIWIKYFRYKESKCLDNFIYFDLIIHYLRLEKYLSFLTGKTNDLIKRIDYFMLKYMKMKVFPVFFEAHKDNIFW